MLMMADSKLIDNPSSGYRKHPGPPVYDQPSLPSQLDAAKLSWGNYNGYAFEFIKHTAGKKHTWQQFATDAAAGKLPTVSWLYADDAMSEHPADTPAQRAAGAGDVSKGSQWTVSQVHAVVSAGLWPHVAIFITWDDWGGWWDHVTPPEVEKWTDGTQFRYGGRGRGPAGRPPPQKRDIPQTPHPPLHPVQVFVEELRPPPLPPRTHRAAW